MRGVKLCSTSRLELAGAQDRIFNLIQFAGAPGQQIGGILFCEMTVEGLHLLQVEWTRATPSKYYGLIAGFIDDSIPIQSAH